MGVYLLLGYVCSILTFAVRLSKANFPPLFGNFLIPNRTNTLRQSLFRNDRMKDSCVRNISLNR